MKNKKIEHLNYIKELCEKGLIFLDTKIPKNIKGLIIGCNFGKGKDRSSNHIFMKPKLK